MKKIFTLFAALACVVSMFGAQETVYFVNADKWTGTINAYAWEPQNANWPGVPATKEAEQLAGCDVYSYSAEAGTYANVIFNNGSKQTADLSWTAGKYFVRDGWYTKEEALVKLGQPIEYESVYFVNVGGWSSVKIYTWSPSLGDWPGVDMKKETETIGGKEVWSHTEMKGASFGGVIFNNGSGTQTGDLHWNAGKYFVTDGWYTKEEAEAKLSGGNTPGNDPQPETAVTYNVTVPVGTNACYIAGEMNGWSQQEMTKVDETHYTITIATATATMKYKYCSGPDWAYVEMQADGVTDVQDRTYAANDVVEAWKAVYDPAGEDPGDDPVVDPETGVTYNVTVPAGTKACYIAGEMNEWKHQEMTKVDETHYTITIAEATTAMGYKYCSGPSWDYVEKTASGDEVANRIYSANDVVESWLAVYEPAGEEPGDDPVDPNPGDDPVVDPETGVTYNVTVPAGTKACYIAGEMNAWSQQEMTKVDETHYTITIATATTAMKYKYCSGPSWDYVEKTAAGEEVADRTYSANDVVESWLAVYDPSVETAVDNVAVGEKAVKVIRNGQMYIIRNGVIYNAMGQIAE